MKKNILFYFLIIMLVSCSERLQINMEEEKEKLMEIETVASTLKNNKIDETYLLHYYEDKYEYSRYEPAEQNYLGAYILSNKIVDYDIKTFEKLVGKPHCLYMYNLKSGETILENWILDCISNMKTPYIVLKIDIESIDTLEDLIKNISTYNIPVFIQISTLDINIDQQKYINFYRNASNLIRVKLPNASIVWSIDKNDVYESLKYYPGDMYVDWIGIEILQTLDDKGQYTNDIEQTIEQFYYTYQKKKPLLISKFAISHFTTYDHVYRTNEASKEIINVYDLISNKYPRIKGIIYLDFNGLDIETKNKSKDNFSVTDNEKMLKAYKNAIEDKKFIAELQSKSNKNGELVTSQYKIYEIEKGLYISKKSINEDFGIKHVMHYGDEKFLDGDTYFNIKNIEKMLNGRFYIEEKTKKVIFA